MLWIYWQEIMYYKCASTRCILGMFEKEPLSTELWVLTKSLRGWSLVHSLLIDTKTSNPLILSISYRRLLFPPEGLHFCVKAHWKLRGCRWLSGRHGCTSSLLCVCLFASLATASALKKKQSAPEICSSLHRTAVCRNAVNLWVLAVAET